MNVCLLAELYCRLLNVSLQNWMLLNYLEGVSPCLIVQCWFRHRERSSCLRLRHQKPDVYCCPLCLEWRTNQMSWWCNAVMCIYLLSWSFQQHWIVFICRWSVLGCHGDGFVVIMQPTWAISMTTERALSAGENCFMLVGGLESGGLRFIFIFIFFKVQVWTFKLNWCLLMMVLSLETRRFTDI